MPETLGGSGGTLVMRSKPLPNWVITRWLRHLFRGDIVPLSSILSPQNSIPRQSYLADLLNGNLTAGTGLSNAMKFLSGIEELNVNIREENGKRYLNGRLPWVTNLRSYRFVASFVAGFQDERKPLVIAIPSTAKGLTRTKELNLSHCKARILPLSYLRMWNYKMNGFWADDAPEFLAATRPAFLGLQFGLPFGLVERSLAEIENRSLSVQFSPLSGKLKLMPSTILKLVCLMA